MDCRIFILPDRIYFVYLFCRHPYFYYRARKYCPHCGREVAVTPQEQALLGKDITTIKRGTGCTHCNGTGYRGRIAVHEIVTIDRNIRRMISRGAEIEEIEAYAREQQGMRSLKEKGLELVKQGVTTPEELLRIAYYA